MVTSTTTHTYSTFPSNLRNVFRSYSFDSLFSSCPFKDFLLIITINLSQFQEQRLTHHLRAAFVDEPPLPHLPILVRLHMLLLVSILPICPSNPSLLYHLGLKYDTNWAGPANHSGSPHSL